MPEQRGEGSWPPAMSSGSDPSTLTMQLILREVAGLDKVLTERMNSVTERIAAAEKTHEVFRNDLTRVPTDVDRAVSQLKEFHTRWFLEKFAGVAQRFRTQEAQIAQLTQAIRDVETRCARAIARLEAHGVPVERPRSEPPPSA